MVDDDDAVARQVDVELEAVGAERQAVIECGEGVLGTQRRAAAMRVDERHGRDAGALIRDLGSASAPS